MAEVTFEVAHSTAVEQEIAYIERRLAEEKFETYVPLNGIESTLKGLARSYGVLPRIKEVWKKVQAKKFELAEQEVYRAQSF